MTEQELAAIEARDRAKRALGGRQTSDVMALVAEVRRLRGLLKSIEWIEGESGGEWCQFCASERADGHQGDCPAF